MTEFKSLLKDYTQVATTTVIDANGDILPAKAVVDLSSKSFYGSRYMHSA